MKIEESKLKIEDRIFTIRGKQVMLDRDLSQLYQVEVSQMNRQVKRNIERFPTDFMFQLTKEEHEYLKCQNGITNTRVGASIKDLGKKWIGFTLMENTLADELLEKICCSS